MRSRSYGHGSIILLRDDHDVIVNSARNQPQPVQTGFCEHSSLIRAVVATPDPGRGGRVNRFLTAGRTIAGLHKRRQNRASKSVDYLIHSIDVHTSSRYVPNGDLPFKFMASYDDNKDTPCGELDH